MLRGGAFRRRNWTYGIGLTELDLRKLKNWTYGTSLQERCQVFKFVYIRASSSAETLCEVANLVHSVHGKSDPPEVGHFFVIEKK